MGTAAARLAVLGSIVRERGCNVITRVVHARSLDAGIAEVAEEVRADLVALGSPPRVHGTTAMLSPFKTVRHRVIDALDVPVIVVPPVITAREPDSSEELGLTPASDT